MIFRGLALNCFPAALQMKDDAIYTPGLLISFFFMNYKLVRLLFWHLVSEPGGNLRLAASLA